MSTEKPVEFYSRLKTQLTENESWPANYLYKFIVPTDAEKINKIHEIFDNINAKIQLRESKKGTYTSISIMVKLKNPDVVIEKYRKVGEIEGVISL